MSDSDGDGEEEITHPSVDGEGHLGARIGGAISGAFSTFVLNIVLLVSRLVPGTWRMWRGMMQAGYRGLYKSSSNCDTIGHIAIGGQIKHVPLSWNHDKERYETLNGEDYWNAAHEAENEYRVAGSVPSVWAAAGANELGSHVQAEVAQALDLGGGRELYKSAQVSHMTADVTGNGGQAMPDGGRQEMVSVHNPGSLADQVVELGSDNRVVSMNKYYETYPSVVDPEEMQRQEERGRLAERDEDLRDYAFKMLLLAVAGIIGALAVVVLGPMLLGGGGGAAVGGVIPGSLPLVGVLG